MLAALSNALSDLRQGIARKNVWVALAQEDIGDQHRRTMLGPLWLLVNYLAFAGVFVFVFRNNSGENYLSYVAIGLLVWMYIMETINNSVTLFTREESFIKGTTLPLTVYVLRLAMQTSIRSLYSLAGCIVLLAISGIQLDFSWIWSALGILLILVTTIPAIILFALAGTFMPDSQFVVAYMMRIGMFLTPVFWVHSGTGDNIRFVFYYWNPFTYFLEIVRAPILTGEFPAQAFLLCGSMSAALWIVALLLFGSLKKDVVFVL